MNQYAGLDVSMKTTAICIVDQQGEILFESEVDSTPEAITKALLKNSQTLERIGLESGPLSHHLTKELLEFGLPVECVDARHLNAFLSVKVNKTDRNDAHGIAEAMRCNAVKQVHLKSDEALTVNAVVNMRESLVETRVKLTNTLRGILKPFGIRSLGSSVSCINFIIRCREAVSDLPSAIKDACQSLFYVLEKIYMQIELMDKRLRRLASGDEDVKLLMSAPGVGPVTALRFKAAIDDIKRFSDSKAVGAYAGLTPKQYSSGEVNRQGRISKQGSKRLRRTLVEAAGVLLSRTKKWSKLKAWGMKLSRKKGFRKAVVAVARKLAVILYRMLETRQQFSYGEPAEKAA